MISAAVKTVIIFNAMSSNKRRIIRHFLNLFAQ